MSGVRPVRPVQSEVSATVPALETPQTRKPLFFWLGGGQNTSHKNTNQGISDFSQFHVCFRLAGIQNLLFLFKVNFQDFPNFPLVESPMEQYFKKVYVEGLYPSPKIVL